MVILYLKQSFIMVSRYVSRIKVKYVLLFVFALVVLQIVGGVFTHLFEKDFFTEFSYPYDGDVHEFVHQVRQGLTPVVDPINSYDYKYLKNCSLKCDGVHDIRLVFLIKSAPAHYNNRIAIRSTWGMEMRFSDAPARTVFLLGKTDDVKIQEIINKESARFHDIVQADFVDSYFNNTIKTMMGFKWAVTFCPDAKYYMFVDDDYYVSFKNVLRFLANPSNYPKYLMQPISSYTSPMPKSDRLQKRRVLSENKPHKQGLKTPGTESFGLAENKSAEMLLLQDNNQSSMRHILNYGLPDSFKLYTGYVFWTAPHRHITSKWHVTLEEYPYDRWPPYVTAGAYILSRESLLDMYYTSFYTKHFRFDDIYVGILAYKARIEPFHCDEFYFYKKNYSPKDYKFTIASHGFNDYGELTRVWTQQKGLGNA